MHMAEIQHKAELQTEVPVELTKNPSKDYRAMAQALGVIVGKQKLIKQQERELAEAEIDPVTLLPNRKAFERDFESLFSRRSLKRGHYMGVAMGDLIYLKATNDTYSPSLGDHYLRTAAQGLKSGVRPTDRV